MNVVKLNKPTHLRSSMYTETDTINSKNMFSVSFKNYIKHNVTKKD